jgi:hypothetical protein
MRPRFAFASLLCCSAAACGGPLDPGAGNSLGTGTQTLTVNGSASADTDLVNPGDALSFTTHFDFRITNGQAPITTGTVTISSNGGDVALTYNNNGQGNGGHWVGDQAGYHEVYALDIVSGTDKVTGVRVDGPDIHSFTAPGLGATVDSTMPLALGWARKDHADLAELSTQQLDHVTVDDTGGYSLAAGSLKSAKDKAVNETIELRRTDQVAPAGAVAGSMVSVSVRNHIDVVVQINPNAP